MSFRLKAVKGTKELDTKLARLARKISPQSGIADVMETGAWIIALEARDNAVKQGLFKSGELVDSIKPVKINQYRVDIRVGVPYGAAHEFGVTVVITDKQRRFFWYMYITTGDTMWKALALSISYTIPARPYLRPAIDNRKRIALEATGRAMLEKIRRTVK